MSFAQRIRAKQRLFFSALMAFSAILSVPHLPAQGIPTVQQNQFRSQWVGDQVDLIPYAGTISPLNALGGVVGPVQTPEEVQREVDASLAGVKAKSPFTFKPALGIGWQISNQGTQSTNSSGTTTYGTASSPFLAPSLAILYDRDHGPWTISAGYSVGYQYFENQNYEGAGTGNQRNPLSQTGLFKAALQMSRYIFNALFTASSGTGYDITSASYNRQTGFNGTMGLKYLLTSSTAVDANAGYNLQNSQGSTATPNNNTTSIFGNFAPVYDLSDKTHISAVLGIGQTSQSLQQASTLPGSSSPTGLQTSSRDYAQALAKVKYDVAGKLSFDLGLGARYISASNITDPVDTGVRPAWTVGLTYTPTEKTSFTLTTGEQGSDVVPELNFQFNWKPRDKTQFSLGIYQSEAFSSTSSSQFRVSNGAVVPSSVNSQSGSQYLITRGVLGTVTQQFFTSVTCTLTGGYTTQQYYNLSGNQSSGGGQLVQNNSQIPGSYLIAGATVVWKIRDWVNLSNTLNYNSGLPQRGANNSTTTTPQAWYSISLNFTL